MFQFHCPDCSTPLRVRDPRARGQRLDCPECGTLIAFEEHGDDVRVVVASGQLPELPRSTSASHFRLYFTIVGILVLSLILILQLPSFTKKSTVAPTAQELEQPETKQPVVNDQDTDDSVGSDVEATKPTVEERLELIGRMLEIYRNKHQSFPGGPLANNDEIEFEQFSWIVELIRNRSENQAQIFPDQPWNARENDGFVRRRLDPFLNPNVKQLTGKDRYPTTHFAGLTGVGHDAHLLNRSDPRAGVFSSKFQTSVGQITDGLSNTIAVVGIQNQFGSWAKVGLSTQRSLTAEPYINGPDGIGTGEANAMQVLMADGSVRTVSDETEPVIMRRMAAIADGLPLDMSVTGDPLNMKPPVSLTVAEDPEEPLIEPVFAPEVPAFNLRGALRQQLISYRMESPQTLKRVLFDFQELLGTSINFESIDELKLKQELQLNLKSITLEDLLKHITDRVELRYEIRENQIYLEPTALVNDQQAN